MKDGEEGGGDEEDDNNDADFSARSNVYVPLHRKRFVCE